MMVHQRDFQKTETVTSESSQWEPVHHAEIYNKVKKGDWVQLVFSVKFSEHLLLFWSHISDFVKKKKKG